MRFKNKQFQRLIRRYDGEAGGGAAVAVAPAVVAATEPAAAAVTPATTTEPAQPYKAFANEADYQKDVDFKIQQALKTHEEKLKGKLTPEIRKQLEAEANMTADQKVQAQLDALTADRKILATDRNRNKAERLFVAKGISEADYSVLLDNCVGEDETESLKRAQTLLDVIDKATNEKIKTAMKDVKSPSSTAATVAGTEESIGARLGNARATANTAAQKTIDAYKFGGKK